MLRLFAATEGTTTPDLVSENGIVRAEDAVLHELSTKRGEVE